MKLAFYLTLLLFLTSCLGNYPTTSSTPSNVSNKSKEVKVKEGVSNHVKNAFASKGAYKNVQFGELFMLKPKEILELDEMIAVKNQLPLQREKYGDSLESVIEAQEVKVAYKKQEIQDNHIYPWYEINHLFAIIPAEKDSVDLYEYDFEVYPNYTIKEAHQKLSLKLSKKEFRDFESFIDQDPVYESNDFNWAYDMNARYFKQCIAALEAENDYKEELLRTILKMSDYIVVNNEFDENGFTLLLVKEWESENLSDVLNEGSYTELSPIISEVDGVEIITGYDILHKLNDADGLTYQYIFDLNFVLISVKQ